MITDEKVRAKIREEFLAKIKKESLRKPEIQVITQEEYIALQEIASFKCPRNKDTRFCDGKSCPSRPEDRTLDYYDECMQAGRVSFIIDKVLNGRITVAIGNNGWSIPV